jgi:hypothetical protein
MKKVLFCLLLCSFLIMGCKKLATSLRGETNYLENEIRNYFSATIAKSTSSNVTKLKATLSKIDFNNIERRNFSGDLDIILVPIKDVNVQDFVPYNRSMEAKVKTNGAGNETKTVNSTVTKTVFYMQHDKIIDGNIIEISSNTYKTDEIESNFTDIIRSKKKDFTGHLSVNYLSQRLSNDWGYKNGVVASSTVMKHTSAPTNAINTVRANTCQAWYLHTDYYIMVDNEMVVYNSTDVFVGTTGCGGSDNQELQPTSDGGGGETPPDTTCAQSKRLANDAAFAANMQELSDSTGLNYEIAYSMVKNPAGGYTYTKMRSPANSATMSVPNSNTDGFMHNHRTSDLSTFSPADIQYIYLLLKTGHISNPAEFMMSVVTASGKIQLFRIADPTALTNFGDTYLGPSQFSSWETTVAGSFTNPDYLSNTIGLLNAISNAGLTLYEGDINSLSLGFQKLSTNGTNTLTKTKCSN